MAIGFQRQSGTRHAKRWSWSRAGKLHDEDAYASDNHNLGLESSMSMFSFISEELISACQHQQGSVIRCMHPSSILLRFMDANGALPCGYLVAPSTDRKTDRQTDRLTDN